MADMFKQRSLVLLHRYACLWAALLHLMIVLPLFWHWGSERQKTTMAMTQGAIGVFIAHEGVVSVNQAQPLTSPPSVVQTKEVTPVAHSHPEPAQEKPVQPAAAPSLPVAPSVSKSALVQKTVKVKKTLLVLQNSLGKNHWLDEIKKEKQSLQRKLSREIGQRSTQAALAKEQKELQQTTGLRGGQSGSAPAVMGGVLAQQQALISSTISSHWIKPDGLKADDVVKVAIQVTAQGEVASQRIISSTGNRALERSAQVAIANASPIPISKELKRFDEARQLVIVFRSAALHAY